MRRLVHELLELNRNHSELFVGQKTARDRHHANHPTNIAAFKCMDGRVNLAALTETPIGIIRPFRNIGGIFDLGWTALNAQIGHYVKTSVEKGRKILFLVTYHFAEGDAHRGCRGHEDVGRAIRSAEKLAEQIRQVFDGDAGIYPILLGVETDHQKLIFHDRGGERIEAARLKDDRAALAELIRSSYPDMHPEIVPDLLPLLHGNIRHLAHMSAAPSVPEDQEHKERTIAIGQGFEWLPHNWALAINDLELTLDDTIGKAAGIIKDNIRSRRINPKEKGLVLASVPYEAGGYERRLAVERARHLQQLGLESVEKFHPDLRNFFEPLTAVMNWQTRRLEVID
jgi:hypothetical protein